MGLTKDIVKAALGGVPMPSGEGDLVGAGCVEWVAACDGYASVRLSVPGTAGPAGEAVRARLAQQAERAVKSVAMGQGIRVDGFSVKFVTHAGDVEQAFGSQDADAKAGDGERPEPKGTPARDSRPTTPLPQAGSRGGDAGSPADDNPLSNVRHVIAVGAGKGGVGKSSISVNLAVGLARAGHAVGLLDGDIYGPSMPTMLGLDAIEQTAVNGKLQPFLVHGVKAITIGKLVEADKPLIWRGPMAHGAFRQLVDRTDWGDLDYMIIDLPPGTGDVPLTMAQSLKLTGAVVVCTPQKVAQDDAVRAARMFNQLDVEVLGVVENMSYFVGDDGKTYDIFGRGGAEQMAQRMNLPFLGAVPITMALREHSDRGEPTKNFDRAFAGEALPKSLDTLVRNLESQVALASMRQGSTRPTLTIS